MPEGLSGLDWLFVVGALVLGFGTVKFILAAARVRRDAGAPVDLPPWHEVLGVAPEADADQIRAARQRLLAPYQPERLAGMGAEFVALAEARTREIEGACAEGLARRG